MKKKMMVVVIALGVVMTGCYNRIGRLTVAATRNVDSKGDYVLLAKDVVAKAKTKKDNCIEMAIDKAVKDYPTGEFMKNVVIQISNSGKKIRIVGDVWGYAPTTATKKN